MSGLAFVDIRRCNEVFVCPLVIAQSLYGVLVLRQLRFAAHQRLVRVTNFARLKKLQMAALQYFHFKSSLTFFYWLDAVQISRTKGKHNNRDIFIFCTVLLKFPLNSCLFLFLFCIFYVQAQTFVLE